MEQLNFPKYEFRISEKEGQKYIFDDIRKKHVKLTPEEWVRQNTIKYLIHEKNYPASLIAVEQAIKVNQNSKRCDIVLYNNTGLPHMIVECKAPSVKISQKTFDQIATYNIQLRVDYLFVTNGMQHFCCKMDYTNNSYNFVKDIPQRD